jgi:hypothetical protein
MARKNRNQRAPIEEYYLSFDVEADGPYPGDYSMIQFGGVLYDHDGNQLDEFKVNLEEIADNGIHPETKSWWASEGMDAYHATRVNMVDAQLGMEMLDAWLEKWSKNARIIAVGYPVTYDFLWVYWYLNKFVGRCLLSFSGLDIKTMAYTMMGAKQYRKASKSGMPPHWLSDLPHTHDALDDAREQGELFFNIRKDVRG